MCLAGSASITTKILFAKLSGFSGILIRGVMLHLYKPAG